MVLNFLEIVGSGGIPKKKNVSNGREYLENCAGDRIKIIGLDGVKIPIAIGEEQIVNNMDSEEKHIVNNGGV